LKEALQKKGPPRWFRGSWIKRSVTYAHLRWKRWCLSCLLIPHSCLIAWIATYSPPCARIPSCGSVTPTSNCICCKIILPKMLSKSGPHPQAGILRTNSHSWTNPLKTA
jgi:hypothetical protein